MKAVCPVCFHHCQLEEGQAGICKARSNTGGCVVCDNYGRVTALSLDPIEKKPLRNFYGGSKILSVGSFGCNLSCPFCQNYGISKLWNGSCEQMTPKQLIAAAKGMVNRGNIGLAYTYNEPLIGYEFVLECGKGIREQGLKNVVVTNGSVTLEVLKEILPVVDAFNVDLKGFTEEFYKKLNGSLEVVKDFICVASEHSHVELTTLVVPGENDSQEDMESLCQWVASVSDNIPLHITRFFPQWNMKDKEPTPMDTMYRLEKLAKHWIKNVYIGNC